MRRNRVWIGTVIVAVGILLSLAPAACANDREEFIQMLRGATRFRVQIGISDPFGAAKAIGLTKEQLQVDVELRLRQFGVTIADVLTPALVIGVDLQWAANRNLIVYDVAVRVLEIVFWSSQEGTLSGVGALWEGGSYGTVGFLVARQNSLRKSVLEQVDIFLNDLLAANPELAAQRPPSIVSPTGQLPARMPAQSSQIRRVQEQLRTAGYAQITPDGVMGPQTENALRWFQGSRGLTPTGQIDDQTLRALNLR